jgi:hypothetical protein
VFIVSFLPQYPQAILKDRLAVLIMVFLERNGLADETDIQNQLNSEKYAVLSALLKLYQDRFLQYKAQSVQVTERGKLLIDALGLADSIVEDILDDLKLISDEREIYQRLLSNYRNTAFNQYLNSLGTIHAWEQLCKIAIKNSVKDDESSTFEVWLKAGKLALLIRDLEIWRSHMGRRSAPSQLHQDFYSSILRMFDLPNANNLPTQLAGSFRQTVYACVFFNHSSAPKLDHTTEPIVSTLIFYMRLLDDFQSEYRIDDWYDAWKVRLQVFNSADDFSDPNHNLNIIQQIFRVGEIKEATYQFHGSEKWWSDTEVTSIDDPMHLLLVQRSAIWLTDRKRTTVKPNPSVSEPSVRDNLSQETNLQNEGFPRETKPSRAKRTKPTSPSQTI